LSEKDVMAQGGSLAFPESVLDLFKGNLGQTVGGFPPELSKLVLKKEKPFTERPNEHLDPIDFDKEFIEFKEKFSSTRSMLDFLSYMMYPKVYEDFYQHLEDYGNVAVIPTTAFFFGLKQREELTVELGKGKVIIIRLLYTSPPDSGGIRTVTFDLNGQTRSITIKDDSVKSTKKVNRKAVEENEVGSPILGRLSAIMVEAGQTIEKDAPLFVIEAMKMESTITAPVDGVIKKVHLDVGEILEQGDLVIEFE
jgi:pyruvate carboxylase